MHLPSAGLALLASVPVCLLLKPSAHHRRKVVGPEKAAVEAEGVGGA